MVIHYHRCPNCGKILESREDYSYRLGSYQKDLQCSCCDHYFTETKEKKIIVGPFFGKGEGAEIDWS